MGTNKSQHVFKPDFKYFLTKHHNCLQDLILLLLTLGDISCGHHTVYSIWRVKLEANWRVRHKSINPQVHVSTPKSLEQKTSELKWVSKRHKRNSIRKGHQQQEKLQGMMIWRSWEGGVQYLREEEGTVKHKWKT